MSEATNVTSVKLPESITIRDVSQLRDEWLVLVEAGEPIEVDASGVEDVDGAGLQLMLSLFRDLLGRGHSVTWAGVSDKFREVVEVLGMNSALGVEQ